VDVASSIKGGGVLSSAIRRPEKKGPTGEKLNLRGDGKLRYWKRKGRRVKSSLPGEKEEASQFTCVGGGGTQTTPIGGKGRATFVICWEKRRREKKAEA